MDEPWLQALRPASFRGIGFFVSEHESAHGRRIALHEFALRDRPFTEDLGRLGRSYRVRAYLIGAAYHVQRDALIAACEGSDQPGTLVHPYYGELDVRCLTCSVRESEHSGRYAELELAFAETGNAEPLPATLDTAQILALAAQQLFALLKEAFVVAYLVETHPNVLTLAALGLLQGIADGYLAGLGLTVAGIAGVVESGIAVFGSSGTLGNPALAATLAASGQPIADAVVGAAMAASDDLASTALASPPPSPGAAGAGDLLAGMDGTWSPAADWTAGLAALAAAGTGVPPVIGTTPTRLRQAANQAAVIDLAGGAATAAILAVLAARTWATAAEAAAARDLVIGLIDARADAAAAADDDALYLAWTGALAAAVDDLDARVASLPVLGAYSVPQGLPALVLAQLLYQDPTRADELRALNNVRRPMFMAAAGAALLQ